MIKIYTLFFLLLFPPVHSFSQPGKDIDMTIELTSKNEQLSPGKIHSLVFKIINNSSEVINFQPYLGLPAGLKPISDLKPQKIASGSQAILIIAFNIPAKYMAGEYNFSLHLVDPSNPGSLISSFESELKVKEEGAVTIDLIESPEFVKAGEEIHASYVIRNIGNTTENLSLYSTDCRIVGSQKINLHPGKSAVIKVTSPTNENITSSNRKSFYIYARNGNLQTGQIYGFVRVMPVNIENNDLFHRFPVTFTARYLTKGKDGNYVGGYQLEARGSGTFDPEGTHKFEFVARGPNQFDLSLLGLYDEYMLNYSNNFMELKAGDHSYSFTPLTEYARYGRGIEQKIHFLGNSYAGALYVTPRFYKNFDSEYGGYLNIGIYKKNTLGFYYLKKKYKDSGDADLYSITANLQPFDRTSVEFEASYGKKNGLSDKGYRLNINSQFSKVSFNSYFFHTGKNYPGYYSNSDFYSGNLNFYATKWLSFGLSARQDFMNAQIDTLLMTSPFSRNYQGLVNVRIGKRMFFKTYVRQYERQDRSPSEKFHYETVSLNASFTHRMRKFGYGLEGETGETRNFLLEPGSDKKKTFRGSGNIFWQPNEKHNLQGFLTYTNVNSFISEQEENNFIFGLTASSMMAKNLRANLQLQNSYSIEEYYRNRNLLQLNIDYHFLKRHRLVLNSYYTIFQNELSNPDFSLSLSYSFTLGIPMKKIAEAGSIAGKIENKGIEDVDGIVLNVGGQSAITDNEGVFHIKNLKPGDYNVLIDRSTINLADIPDIATPIKVTVVGNQETNLHFGMTKAAKISGTIQVESSENELLAPDESNNPIGHLILELHHENESIRIISDGEGHFSFPQVRPGKWFLKVYSNGLDKQYVIKKDYFNLDLLPGQQIDLTVEIQKKKRNIIFINNNVNLSSGDNK